MSTRTSRGRISRTRPFTMLPSLKSRRDFAISSCISVITFTKTIKKRLPNIDLFRVANTGLPSRNQRDENLAEYTYLRKGGLLRQWIERYFIRRTERAR